MRKLSTNQSAMFGQSVRGVSSCYSRISASAHLLRSAAKVGKSGSSKVRKVSVLSSALQLCSSKGNSSNNLISMQEKCKNVSRNYVSITTTCETPQILVQLITESGIGTELQEDDDEMSSVSGKEKHRRKQKY